MTLLSAAVLLFFVMDPLGNVPLFLAALRHVDPTRYRAVIVRELLIALGILFLSEQWMVRSIGERAWARSQAIAIVEGGGATASPPLVAVGPGIYVGLVASIAIVLFGLTIIVKRAAKPYAGQT